LRAACAKDADIWTIYPVNMLGEGLDEQIARFLGGGWTSFSIFHGDALVGTTSYINPDPANRSVEIGGTYIEPSVRGGDFNRRIKHLMLDRAFATGFDRAQFHVDTRNGRSMRARCAGTASPGPAMSGIPPSSPFWRRSGRRGRSFACRMRRPKSMMF
jgi:hypothetical protein